MIDAELLPALRTGKNLLAFSAGVDSTALFFLLLEHDIPFDVALVNYQTRPESAQEAAHAAKLCDRYGKHFFLKTATIEGGNFEAKARTLRYDFFKTIIQERHYTQLLTAHQLDDWLEWFLMQLSKGAGFFELAGMRPVEERDGYRLLRPLLAAPKQSLLAWLKARDIEFFEDASNQDTAFLRNRFRQNYAKTLMADFAPGIARSFAALQADRLSFETPEAAWQRAELTLIDKDAPDAAHQVDLAIKRLGHLPTHSERLAIAQKKSGVYGQKAAVAWGKAAVFVAPYKKADRPLPKAYKEQCRLRGIPPLVRGYLFRAGLDPAECGKPEGQNAS